MIFKRLILGDLDTNCYIVGRREAVIIDPGANPGLILGELEKMGAKVRAILLTHGHFDHYMAAGELKKTLGVPLYIHEKDARMLGDPSESLSFFVGQDPPKVKADGYLKEGDVIRFGKDSLRVIETPGHSGGSVTFAGEDILFCGDLLFYENVGRCDDQQAFETELASIALLMTFDDNTLVCPGHGEYTTIGHEREHNPYLK